MPSKSESSDAQSGNPSLSGSSFTPESGSQRAPSLLLLSKPGGHPLLRRGVAQLLRAIKASWRCTHYSHHPAIYSQTWLFLLAVIR